MFWDIFKIIAYFCVCVFVIWLSYRVSKGMSGYAGKFNSTKYMKGIDRMVLSKDSTLHIVQIGERYVLLGVSNGKIEMLCELSEEDLIDIRNKNLEENIYDTMKKNFLPTSLLDKVKKVGGKFRRNGNSSENEFSDMLYENMGKIHTDDENGKTSDSIVDELLKDSESRMNKFKNRTSDKRGGSK